MPQLSDQAEISRENPRASDTLMRILIELQVIAILLHDNMGHGEDLRTMRQSVADSIR